MNDREIVEDEFQIACMKWKIPEEEMPKIFDHVLNSSISQARTFFEVRGWSFMDNVIVPGNDCPPEPEGEYETRLRTGVFYATKAYYEGHHKGIDTELILDRVGNPLGEEE